MTASGAGYDGLSLAGKRAVVTGAGRGIGRAAAELLAARGAEVILLARSLPELQEVVAGIIAAGGRAEAIATDVVEDAALTAAFEKIGTADLLVNSAGTNRPKPFVDVTPDDLDTLIGLNLRAVFRVTQFFVRQALSRRAPGVIVNISSQMGHVGAPDRSVYCATKHAVEGMTKALAVELAPQGIRIVSVAPTFVETAMTRPFLTSPVESDALLAKVPIGRFGTVTEVAEVVAFLVSPAAALVTGSSVLVDGGWVAQ
ncbi:SDR family oxidoreductase [Mycobacterium sp. 21AC1]|uniref:SDR family NAD(P)-dependent oxidoreductase n=1 Tax=[Mycobacterium] appelbergii TaxID=2939269 RepID=UPI002938D947|nr:SDR family NAD(P)-dependent oxidoreductase [Mycobacterium sp. 21AC1]MDV3127023.1 SDR family oxidoreductase [Mycobacterium sp. 21AC1]